MRIDGIRYEHKLSVEDLQNIRGHLVETVQYKLGQISLVNQLLDQQTQDQLPFEPSDGEAIVIERTEVAQLDQTGGRWSEMGTY
jgi:hypothetical protein